MGAYEDLIEQTNNAAAKRVQDFVENGVDVNAKDEKGATPLHKAAGLLTANTHALRFLIEQGADINAKDNEGKTPLDYAMSNLKSNRKNAKTQRDGQKGATYYNKHAEAKDMEARAIKYERWIAEIEKIVDFLRKAGGASSVSDGGIGWRPPCLVVLVALGTLLTAGFCGLALFISNIAF